MSGGRTLALSTSTYRAENIKRLAAEKMTWEQFADWLDLDNPDNAKFCGAYVGGRLRKGVRKKGEVLGRDFLTLDADHVTDPDALIEAVKDRGWTFLAYTTYNSTPDAPRLRIVSPLSRTVTAEEFGHITRVIIAELGAKQFDSRSDEAERYMLRPSTQDRNTYRSWKVASNPLPVEEYLAKDDPNPEAARRDSPIERELTEYADLTPERQELAREKVERVRSGFAKRLAHAADWPDGATDEEGRGWDALAFDAASSLGQLALAPWAPISEEEAREAFLSILPDVMQAERFLSKWDPEKAYERGNVVPPWQDETWRDRSTPEEDFTVLSDAAVSLADEPEAVRKRVEYLLADARAREIVAAANAAQVQMPEPLSLRELLDESDEPVRWRIETLWPEGGRVILSAQQKSGKTTFVGNVLRSLADGDPFLGKYATEPVQRVTVIDNELNRGMIRSWLRDQGIRKPDRVELVPMRGQMSSFTILDAAGRARWAELLRGSDVLVFDCLRPALDALGLDENHDAGRFLEALDALAAEAGIAEVFAVHHMGHKGERSRGDSRIQDWPDANWRLLPTMVDGEPDPAGPRSFWAYGRDVDKAATELAYDATTRRLTDTDAGRVKGASRVQLEETADAIAGWIAQQGTPPTGNALEKAMVAEGHERNLIRTARGLMVRDGRLIEEPWAGKGRGKQYRRADPAADFPDDIGADLL